MIYEEVEEFGEPLEEIEGPVEYPFVPLRDTVMFPHIVTPLFVARSRSVKAIEAAIANEANIVVAAQRDADEENPTFESLYSWGVEASIARILHMPDGSLSVLAQGKRRVKIIGFVQTEPYVIVRVEYASEPKDDSLSIKALMRAVKALLEKAVELSKSLPEEAYVSAMNISDPGWLADLTASILELEISERQEVLETLDPNLRLQKLSVFLAREIDVLELEDKIYAQVQEGVDKSQREYFLREQMRVIRSELGELDAQVRALDELREKMERAGLPDEVREKAEEELSRLEAMPANSPEIAVIRTYLDWLVELPWVEATEDNLDIKLVSRLLDENHYGLGEAKERILEHMAVKKLASSKMRTPILCFVGPPGTGKTSLGRSIAEALNRKFVRVSLGGIRDEAEIRGHRRTYVGAMPGRIIQTMRRAKTINPLFMLDEIDKIGTDFRGDPAAALLEVLDPEQNYAFSDHYLDVPYDLSKVMFITTANILDTIPPTLRDRMEVIRFPGYTEEEKLEIAKRFLVPRQMEQHGLRDVPCLADSTLRLLIREYTSEAGVRNLEREIAQIYRKAARRLAEGKRVPLKIRKESLARYLGPPRFAYGVAEEGDEVGVATGVAWTEAGGDILSVEATIMEGRGNLILTGQLGEVMQESAQAALSYARAHAKELGIKAKNFDKLDIHIHIPEGAIPKDGPSAGITIATALISALAERPVRKEVVMTGEITLRGKILSIGGLKEKVLAAHRAGLKTILLPKQNEKDMVEIPKKVRKNLNFVFVSRMDEVLPVALLKEQPKASQKG